jgi:hypothetical protein
MSQKKGRKSHEEDDEEWLPMEKPNKRAARKTEKKELQSHQMVPSEVAMGATSRTAQTRKMGRQSSEMQISATGLGDTDLQINVCPPEAPDPEHAEIFFPEEVWSLLFRGLVTTKSYW